MMEDSQIKEFILNVLEGSSYELVSFQRDHMCFGNMIAQIRIGKSVYRFLSDKGDIYRDDKLVFPHTYHIKGEDDAPLYFIMAIEQLVH